MLNHLYSIHRSPDEIIKVDVDFEGIKSDVSINTATQKIEIHAPAGLTPEQMEAWKTKVGTGDKLVALANQKLMETNRQITDAEKTIQQKLQEAENIRLENIKKQQQLDVALANLGNANAQTSNSAKVKPLHEFLGIKAEELPNYIADNPVEFSQKQGEYIAEITTNAVNNVRQTDQSAASLNAIKQKAIADNVDFTDFVNFCAGMEAKPNDYTLSVYKTIKTGQVNQQTTTKPLYDFSKYTTEILPTGSSPNTSFETIRKTPGAVDNLRGDQLTQYMDWLYKQQPEG